MKNLRKYIFNNFYLYIVLLYSINYFTGCSGSYPRFTSVDPKEEIKEEVKEDNILVRSDEQQIPPAERNPLINENELFRLIKKNIGVPYIYGGKDNTGFDCSGFASYIYKKGLDKKILPVTTEQYKVGRIIAQNDLKFGDLVFFNTTGRIPSHVGIFVGNNSFAHASVVKGVTISSLSSEYYKKRYVGARRVIF